MCFSKACLPVVILLSCKTQTSVALIWNVIRLSACVIRGEIREVPTGPVKNINHSLNDFPIAQSGHIIIKLVKKKMKTDNVEGS